MEGLVPDDVLQAGAGAVFVGPAAPHVAPGRPAPYLRRAFRVHPGLRRALFHVTGLGLVDPWMNGTRVGEEVLVPGWTSYGHRLLYDTHDVTALLREGENVVGAVLGDGWAVGRVGFSGRRCWWSDRPALLARLDLHYDDRVEHVGTDEAWLVGTGGTRANDLYDGETYDGRLEPAGWLAPGFDESSWSPAVRCQPAVRAVLPRGAPGIRRIEEIPAVTALRTPRGRTVLDFGQVLTGWVRLRTTGPRGAVVTLRHCELLVDGEPVYESNRTAEATDRYVLSGAGVETWEPRFTFHGFRYVDVEGWPDEEIAGGALTAVVVHSDLARAGWFEVSDPLLQRLHSNVVWSFRGNAVGIPSDCPQRDERLGWTGDLNAFASSAAFLYDTEAWLSSWLQDLSADQAALGTVPYVVPHVEEPPRAPAALWGDAAVNVPWALYQEYGDVSVLERQYSSMVAFGESVLPHLGEDGLWTRAFQFGDWLDPDAPSRSPFAAKTHPHLVATAFLVRTVGQLAQAAAAVGREGERDRFMAWRVRTRDAFRREWVTPSGRLVEETATAYSLAICFGILDDDQVPRAGRRLAEIVAGADHRITTGFAGTAWVLHALTASGQIETAYRLLRQTRSPSFLYPVTVGATTVWERWDAILRDGRLNSTGMTSLNHYALGAFADWMHRVVGGLRPAAPGYKEVEVAPLPGGGLRSAAVRKVARLGEINVAWQRDEDHFVLDLDLPPGVSGTVVLPFAPGRPPVVVGPGVYRWAYDLPPPERYGLDTPIHVLRGDPVVWPAVAELLQAVVPAAEVVVDHLTRAWPTLRALLDGLPRAAPSLEADLARAVEREPTWY